MSGKGKDIVGTFISFRCVSSLCKETHQHPTVKAVLCDGMGSSPQSAGLINTYRKTKLQLLPDSCHDADGGLRCGGKNENSLLEPTKDNNGEVKIATEEKHDSQRRPATTGKQN